MRVVAEIEMPNSCDECRFKISAGAYCTLSSDDNVICIASNGERSKDCPLIPSVEYLTYNCYKPTPAELSRKQISGILEWQLISAAVNDIEQTGKDVDFAAVDATIDALRYHEW